MYVIVILGILFIFYSCFRKECRDEKDETGIFTGL